MARTKARKRPRDLQSDRKRGNRSPQYLNAACAANTYVVSAAQLPARRSQS